MSTLNKLTVRIGELILYVSRKKKIGPNTYSQTKLELSNKELKEIYRILGKILKRKRK